MTLVQNNPTCTTSAITFFAAALLAFLVPSSNLHAQSARPGVNSATGAIAIMMADGPHFFVNGKEIDLAHAAGQPHLERIELKHHRVSSSADALAENTPPPSPTELKQLAMAEPHPAQQPEAAESTHARYEKASPHRAAPVDEDGTTQITVMTVCLGQSMAHIRSSMGSPDRIVASGDKTVYVYDGIKVTFKAGLVAAVD